MAKNTIVETDGSIKENEEIRSISKCQCGGCNQYFVGMSTFEQHRITDNGKRRCMTMLEMQAFGLATEACMVRKYVENHASRELCDVWYNVAERDAVRARFAGRR